MAAVAAAVASPQPQPQPQPPSQQHLPPPSPSSPPHPHFGRVDRVDRGALCRSPRSPRSLPVDTKGSVSSASSASSSDSDSDCEDHMPTSPLPPTRASSAHQALAILLSPTPHPHIPPAAAPTSPPTPPSPSSSVLYHHRPPSSTCDHPPPSRLKSHSPRQKSALLEPASSASSPCAQTQLLANQIFSTPDIVAALVRNMQSNDAGGCILFPFLMLSRAMYHAIIRAWWARMDLKNPWALDLVAQRLVAHATEVEAATQDQEEEHGAVASSSSSLTAAPASDLDKTDENTCSSIAKPAEDKPMSPPLQPSQSADSSDIDIDIDLNITDADLADLDDFIEDEDMTSPASSAVANTSIQDVSMLNLSAYLSLPPLRIPDPIVDNLSQLASSTKHLSLTGIRSYAHASRHAPNSMHSGAPPRFVQSDAMPAATYLLSRTPNLTSLALDLAMIPSSVTVAHALDALPHIKHLHLRDTSAAGVPISGKLVYSIFGHPSLTSLETYHVHVHHSLEIHSRLAAKNAAYPLDKSPLKHWKLVNDRYALVGPHADHLCSVVFLLDVLPALASVHVVAANIPHVLLDAIASTHRPLDGKQGIESLTLDLPARGDLPAKWIPTKLLPLGAGRLQPPPSTAAPSIVPHIKHLVVRSLGTLPRALPSLLSALPHLESISLAATNNSIFLLTDTLATHPKLRSLTLAGDIEPGTLPLLGLPPTDASAALEHLHMHGDQPLCTLALMRLAANLPRNHLRGFSLMAGVFVASDPIGAPLRPVPVWLVAWVCKYQSRMQSVGLRVRNERAEVDVVLHALCAAVDVGGEIRLAFARCGNEGACTCLTRGEIRDAIVRVMGARKVVVLDVHRCPPRVKVPAPAVTQAQVFTPVFNPLLSPLRAATAVGAAGASPCTGAALVLSPTPAAPAGGAGRKRKRTDAATTVVPPPRTPMSPPSSASASSSFAAALISTPTKPVPAVDSADADVEDEDGEDEEADVGTPRKRIGLTPVRGGGGTPRAVPVVATPAKKMQVKEEVEVTTRVRGVEWGPVEVVEVDKWIENVVDEW